MLDADTMKHYKSIAAKLPPYPYCVSRIDDIQRALRDTLDELQTEHNRVLYLEKKIEKQEKKIKKIMENKMTTSNKSEDMNYIGCLIVVILFFFIIAVAIGVTCDLKSQQDTSSNNSHLSSPMWKITHYTPSGEVKEYFSIRRPHIYRGAVSFLERDTHLERQIVGSFDVAEIYRNDPIITSSVNNNDKRININED